MALQWLGDPNRPWIGPNVPVKSSGYTRTIQRTVGPGSGGRVVRGYGGVASNALARWLNQQKQATAQFASAEKPLQESVQMFQPGGGYGAGQKGLLQEQAKQAQAEALSSQVATGMSSGSLATGTGLRVKRDLAQGLAGVEDVRTQFLAQALQSLSGLRGTQAQTTAGVVDPTYAPLMSAQASGYSADVGAQSALQRMQLQASIAASNRASQERMLQMKIQAARSDTGGAYSTMKF